MIEVWKYWDDCFIHGFKPGELEEKMLKGSGDFSPKDPPECPENCPYYDSDLAPHECQQQRGCVLDPPDPNDYPVDFILKGE